MGRGRRADTVSAVTDDGSVTHDGSATHGSGRLLLAVEATPEKMDAALRDAWAGGPAVLPLDPRLPPRARGGLVADLKPGAIVKPGGLVALPGGQPVPDDTVVVVPTSGSTGKPKGVMLSRSAVEASTRLGLDATDSDPDVPWLCCLPTSHVAGVLVLLRAIVTGTPAVLHDDFDVEAIRALDGPVHLAVVPTMLRRLLDAGVDPDGWGTVLVGGARLTDGLVERVPGLTTTYGSSETSGGCVYDGVPLRGVDVGTTDDGRLTIGGPTLMTGYRTTTPGTGQGLVDGRFVTSDVGEVGADGRVTVIGRADDVIVTGGEKVVAASVASLLEQHPAIAEAEVVGVPDAEWGQRAVAVVVPDQVGAVLSLAILRSFVAERMPRYAAPRDLVVVNALPRLPSGKVDRLALQRAVAAEAQ